MDEHGRKDQGLTVVVDTPAVETGGLKLMVGEPAGESGGYLWLELGWDAHGGDGAAPVPDKQSTVRSPGGAGKPACPASSPNVSAESGPLPADRVARKGLDNWGQ